MNTDATHTHHPEKSQGGQAVRDPVCGMEVDPHSTPFSQKHGGRTYYFCSAGCLAKFQANPSQFTGPERASEAVPEGTIYTCPMHPEIRQNGPGNCPICGMALEPLIAEADAGPSAELRDMTRRFWAGLALSLPVLALEMGGHLIGLDHLIGRQTSNWVQLVLATPVVIWAGWPFFVRGWQSLVNRSLNMFTLIAMGTGVAWIYSIIATVAPDIFPAALRNPDGSVPVYFEAAAVITVLVLLGSGAGTAGAGVHQRRDPGSAGSGAQHCPAHPGGRHRGGSAAGRGDGRRSSSHPSGREDRC